MAKVYGLLCHVQLSTKIHTNGLIKISFDSQPSLPPLPGKRKGIGTKHDAQMQAGSDHNISVVVAGGGEFGIVVFQASAGGEGDFQTFLL